MTSTLSGVALASLAICVDVWQLAVGTISCPMLDWNGDGRSATRAGRDFRQSTQIERLAGATSKGVEVIAAAAINVSVRKRNNLHVILTQRSAFTDTQPTRERRQTAYDGRPSCQHHELVVTSAASWPISQNLARTLSNMLTLTLRRWKQGPIFEGQGVE
ncbi:hypothetical protein DFH07DRAFT_76851 [Mycena maculata]|uniref:Secreted protein n=1 Tax=Mycena maculata TaxID=230809 RepID=A0AAD7IBZ1_9AGAR|nr:hypothetical protein DFH07DRAFT_76851 [Mycena maculata]